MDVKTAIETSDAAALRRLLADAPARADELIRWGKDCRIATHPLHYVSDMRFEGRLQSGKELPLMEALIHAGANVDFQWNGEDDTPLIGAVSLGGGRSFFRFRAERLTSCTTRQYALLRSAKQ